MTPHTSGTPDDRGTDLSPLRIAAAADRLDAVFTHTPQFVSDDLSDRLGREVVVKNETMTPIGSFKGRGTSLLAARLDPAKTWVCPTAGNFGQGLAYVARARGAQVEAFVSPDVPAAKVDAMRALGARVHVSEDPDGAARRRVRSGSHRQLVLDGLGPEMAEGAGTIAVELEAAGPIDVAVIQIGDGALISGVACWLKATRPQTRIIGVCAGGAPAMAKSFAAGRVITTPRTHTIATALAISKPIPKSLARITSLVNEIVLVDDDDLRSAQRLILDALGMSVEPGGAAGVAALAKHGRRMPPGRAAVVLTGAELT
jgi:threonine dehydratase